MMTKTYRTRALGLIAAGLILPALAACSRSEPEEQPSYSMENDTGVTETAVDNDMPAMVNEATPVVERNMAEEAPPPPPAPVRTVDQQMMDDASATGMTARVSRDAPPAETPTATDAPKDGE